MTALVGPSSNLIRHLPVWSGGFWQKGYQPQDCLAVGGD
jgi:hypothetical protein